jgi:hypothetical protein
LVQPRVRFHAPSDGPGLRTGAPGNLAVQGTLWVQRTVFDVVRGETDDGWV